MRRAILVRTSRTILVTGGLRSGPIPALRRSDVGSWRSSPNTMKRCVVIFEGSAKLDGASIMPTKHQYDTRYLQKIGLAPKITAVLRRHGKVGAKMAR